MQWHLSYFYATAMLAMFFMAIAEAKQPSNAAPPQGGASRAVSGKGGPRVRWQLGSIGEEGGNVIAQGRAASATEAVRDAITAAREMDFSRALRRDRQSAHPERTGLKLSPAMQRVAAQMGFGGRRLLAQPRLLLGSQHLQIVLQRVDVVLHGRPCRLGRRHDARSVRQA